MSATAEPTTLGEPGRMLYGDPIRVLGTVAVVFGHCADMSLFVDKPLTEPWVVASVVEAMVRWAVPCYIMLSGALLLPARQQTPRQFYLKRLSRIGVPLVFWSIVFTLFGVYYTGWVSWETALGNLFMGKPYAHMYFIFSIAGLYALTPALRVFVRHASRPMLLGTTILLLVLACGDSVARSLTRTELNGFTRFAPFMGYYLAGYLLRDVRLTPRGLWLCVAGWVGCIVLLGALTPWLVVLDDPQRLHGPPSLGLLLYDFLSPVRIPLSVFAWLVLTHIFRQRWTLTGQPWMTWIASTTLGIYLVHPLFREVLFMNGYGPNFLTIYVGLPLMTLNCYVLSLATVAAVQKIRYLNRVMG